MARHGILTGIAAPSILALGLGLSACAGDEQADSAEQPDQQGQEPPDSPEIDTGTAESGDEGEDSGGGTETTEDPHTPVEDSEYDDGFDSEAPERVMCELLGVEDLESIYGTDFSEPGNVDDPDNCLWVSTGGGEEYVELSAEQITAEEWEAIRQDQGVQHEYPEFGDDAFVDDAAVGHIQIDNIIITVDEGILEKTPDQTEDVLTAIHANL